MSKIQFWSMVVCWLVVPLHVTAQQPPAATEPQAVESQQPATQKLDMGDQLIEAIKKTEGCLGVDSCRWQSGKQSIVAWFENKEAVVNWYYNDVHQTMVGGQTAADVQGKKPLEFVTDEDQPIMVVATLTPSRKPELPGVYLPIKQISIELFSPLPGGAHINGRLSPDTFEVPHMRGYSPEPAKITDSSDDNK